MLRRLAIGAVIALAGCSASKQSAHPLDGSVDAAVSDAGIEDAAVGDGSVHDAAPGTNADLPGGSADLQPMGPCADTMALVSVDGGTFCIDRYEGATLEIAPDGGESPHPYYLPVDGLRVRAIPAANMKPQAYISGDQAAAACELSNKRLCTLTEWMAACQGPSGWTYPYGDTYHKGYCNEGQPSCLAECFNPVTYSEAELSDPCCDQQPNSVAPGGSFSECVSFYGVYDMHGNVHEWIDGTAASGHGEFKGGYFVDATINHPGCLYITTAHDKSYHDYSTGFRCCSDPGQK